MLFLNHFKLLNKNYYISDSELVRKLSDYYESEIWEKIRILAEYDQQNWSQIQKQLYKQFYKNDTYQQIYLKSFLKIFKNQSHTMKKNIEIYCFMFHLVFMNLVECDMLDNHTCYCWFLLDLSRKMWSKFMKKYDIDSENSSMLNFKELYTATVKKARHIEFKHNLMKTMRESAFKKLNHWKKSLTKIDTIIICADDTFSSLLTAEFTKKSKSKTILNAIIQHQLNNLNSKIEIF